MIETINNILKHNKDLYDKEINIIFYNSHTKEKAIRISIIMEKW